MKYILTSVLSIISAAGAYAGSDGMLISTTQVPTLGEWGMIATVVALGIIGFFALRKRLASGSR